jgi:hypothetical protein
VEVDDRRSLVQASTPDPKPILSRLGYESELISTNRILAIGDSILALLDGHKSHVTQSVTVLQRVLHHKLVLLDHMNCV